MVFNDFGDIQILLGPVLEHWNRPTYWAFLRNSIIFGIVRQRESETSRVV